jgi:hypothetical protein
MTTQEIKERAEKKANEAIAKGDKMPFDKLVASYVKQLERQQPRQMTSKDIKKIDSANRVINDGVEHIKSGKMVDNSDIYREASIRQRGSSMRG